MLLRSRSKEMSGALYIPPVMCLRLLVRHLCEGRCSQRATLGLRALLRDPCLLKCPGIYHGTATPRVSAPQFAEAGRVLLLSLRAHFSLCSSVGEKSCWNQSWRKWLKTQHSGKWNLINGSKLANLRCKLLLFCLLAWGNMSERCLPFLSTSLLFYPSFIFTRLAGGLVALSLWTQDASNVQETTFPNKDSIVTSLVPRCSAP